MSYYMHLLQNFAFIFFFSFDWNTLTMPVSKIYDFHVRDYSGLN